MSVLEFIAHLVGSLSWPVAVAFLLWTFRGAVRQILPRTRKFTFPGGEWEGADLAQTEDNLRREVEEKGPVLVAHETPATQLPTDGTDGEQPGDREAPPTPSVGLEAFEDLVRRAAEWGAARGRAGYSVDGLAVRWAQDGRPRLELPPSNSVASIVERITGDPNAVEISGLQNQIDYLQRAIERSHPGKANRLFGELQQARARLEALGGREL